LSDDVLVDEGGLPSEHSTNMRRSYHFSEALKSGRTLAVSVGWCKAVAIAQGELTGGRMVLGKPVLVLSSTADEVLDHSDIDELSDFLVPDKKDGKGNALADGGAMLVERVIESTVTERSGHDVLAAESALKVDEAMSSIESWLGGRFY